MPKKYTGLIIRCMTNRGWEQIAQILIALLYMIQYLTLFFSVTPLCQSDPKITDLDTMMFLIFTLHNIIRLSMKTRFLTSEIKQSYYIPISKDTDGTQQSIPGVTTE